MLSRSTLVLGLLGLLGAPGWLRSPTEGQDPAPRDVRASGEFFKRYCLECHAGPEPEAGLDLEAPLAEAPQQHEQIWLRALRRIERGEMPPRSAEQPVRAEALAVAATLRINLAAAYDPRLSESPGPLLPRRLTRSQIRHALADRFGIEAGSLRRWPADPIAHGFDHLPESLSLNERDLERLFVLAEEVAEQVLPRSATELKITERRLGAQLDGGQREGDSRVLSSNGALRWRSEVPRAGRYRLQAQLYADQAGPELARAQLRAGEERDQAQNVKAEEAPGETLTFEFTAESGGSLELAVAFVNDFYVAAEKSPGGRAEDRNLHVEWLALEGPLDELADTRFELELEQERGLPRRGAGAWTKRDSDRLAADLCQELWRGAASAAESQALLQLAETSDRRSGLRDLLVGLLVSPRFLLVSESLEATAALEPGDCAPLSPTSLVERLSLLLLDSPPDAALLAEASPGLAADPDRVEALARRLLADPRSARFVRSFGEQWLGLRALAERQPDLTHWPSAPPGLIDSMTEEPLLLLEAVLRENRPTSELLVADYSFVDRRLAAWYGWPAPAGIGFERISLARTPRRGLLTQAAILTVTSDPSRTTPVKRGKWVLETLLGAPTPPPPPGVGNLEEPAPGARPTSLRERLQQHRAKRACAACHAQLDPLGLALEGFDALGQERREDSAGPIDTSAVLPDGRKLVGARELIDRLAEPAQGPLEPSFSKGLCEHLATYVLARPLLPADRPLIGRLLPIAERGSLADLLIELVRSRSFRERRSALR